MWSGKPVADEQQSLRQITVEEQSGGIDGERRKCEIQREDLPEQRCSAAHGLVGQLEASSDWEWERVTWDDDWVELGEQLNFRELQISDMTLKWMHSQIFSKCSD